MSIILDGIQVRSNEAETVMRIVIADDSDDYREALVHAIDGCPDLSVVGAARNGAELIAICNAEHPDIAMTDLRMPVIDGISAIREISKESPRILLVAFSTANSAPIRHEALAAGAHIFFPKDQAMTALRSLSKAYEEHFRDAI